MEMTQLNWYPGHMKKTRELIQKNLRLIDVLVEVVDSRIPLSSKNPDIEKLSHGKSRILLLNKEDLANPQETKRWIQYFETRGYQALSGNCASGKGMEQLLRAVEIAFQPKAAQLAERGIQNRGIRLMIVGVPNSGKSSLVNRLMGKKAAQTGDKPGVTKGKQWVRLRGNLELLDTPGILWPKFEDQRVARMLAYTGAIKDQIMEIDDLAFSLLDMLRSLPGNLLQERYALESLEVQSTLEMMEEIARRRGFLLKGAQVDYRRTAENIVSEFRQGFLGRITLERVEREGASPKREGKANKAELKGPDHV